MSESPPFPPAECLFAEGLGYQDTGGRVHLHDIDLSVARGELLVVTGLSGGGKSLLVKALHGLVRATHGTLRLLGKETRRLGHWDLVALWQRTGFVFQEGALISNLSLRANIELPMRYHAAYSDDEARARADALLGRFDIESHADLRPGGLSLGVKKLCSLARALSVRPEVLFADELFVGMSPVGQRMALEALTWGRAEWGMAGVLVAGDLDPVRGALERLAILHKGTLVADADPATLRSHPDPDVRAVAASV